MASAVERGRRSRAPARALVTLGGAGWLLLATALPAPAAGALNAPEDVRALARTFLLCLLDRQVTNQTALVAQDAGADAPAEIQQAIDARQRARAADRRRELEGRYGSDARARFEQFVGAFVIAEQDRDAAFLAEVAVALAFPKAPADFDAFRRGMSDRLGPDLAEAGRWLAEVQTWSEVRRRARNTPPLDPWLHRHEPGGSSEEILGRLKASELAESEEPLLQRRQQNWASRLKALLGAPHRTRFGTVPEGDPWALGLADELFR